MDFSRPDNARKINRLKILNALRKGSLSRAELSRELLINKVSISEITEVLIKEGLILETAKEMTTGRPATKLAINRNAGRAFSIEVKKASVSVSVSDALGKVLRFERIPRTTSMWDDIEAMIKRLALDYRVIGVCIVSKEELNPMLPWPVMTTSPAIAESVAEINAASIALDGFYFVSWSDEIEGCYLSNKAISIPSFAHIRVTKEGLCSCGASGCLNTVASGSVLKEKTGKRSLREISEDNQTMAIPSRAMAFALTQALQATGASNVMITGELSQMSDETYAQMQSKLIASLPPDRQDAIIFRSQCGERGLSEGAGIMALEKFFYSSELLRNLSLIEADSCP